MNYVDLKSSVKLSLEGCCSYNMCQLGIGKVVCACTHIARCYNVVSCTPSVLVAPVESLICACCYVHAGKAEPVQL